MKTVLYYTPKQSKRVTLLKSIFVRLGIHIRNVEPGQVMEKVGFLAGLKGFEKAHETPEVREETKLCETPEVQEETELHEKPEVQEETELHEKLEDLPQIPEEVLVLKGFTGRDIDALLSQIRRAGLPKVELKAVLTESNSQWTFYQLYKEIKEEHEKMREAAQQQQ